MDTEISAIRFKQWLPEWDDFEFDADQHRRKPDPYIFLFSMPAVQLRALSGVYRRKREGRGAEGLQRFHDEKRSRTIRDYVRFGYPYSSLSEPLRRTETDNLRKPGWLPTAIVVNILRPEDIRRGRRVAPGDLITVRETHSDAVRLKLPYGNKAERWGPSDLEPFEVIDGQHRLWAFDEAVSNGKLPGDFELPVVAFYGLDVGWQAYLFWSINVSPKRINPSHAFDLYPLLRSQDWLETFSELRVYREARAQELTDILYQQPESPWRGRINMLGESGRSAPATAGVTQAGWVRALSSSFLAPGGRGRATKGLFSAAVDQVGGPLDWPRPQQAAFLIKLWADLREAVIGGSHPWTRALQEGTAAQASFALDLNEAPFTGPRTMLNQEQGVRGVLAVANELLFAMASLNRSIFEWQTDVAVGGTTNPEEVSAVLKEVSDCQFAPFVSELTAGLASFDWRSADAPGLSTDERLTRRAFRGSGGYVALREQLMAHLGEQRTEAGVLARSWLAAQPMPA